MLTGGKQEDEIEAIVSAVKGSGSKKYAVAYPRDDLVVPKGKAITFSLSDWKGDREPGSGQVVVLTEVVEFAKGLRAQCARPIRIAKRRQEQHG